MVLKHVASIFYIHTQSLQCAAWLHLHVWHEGTLILFELTRRSRSGLLENMEGWGDWTSLTSTQSFLILSYWFCAKWFRTLHFWHNEVYLYNSVQYLLIAWLKESWQALHILISSSSPHQRITQPPHTYLQTVELWLSEAAALLIFITGLNSSLCCSISVTPCLCSVKEFSAKFNTAFWMSDGWSHVKFFLITCCYVSDVTWQISGSALSQLDGYIKFRTLKIKFDFQKRCTLIDPLKVKFNLIQ